MIHIGRSWVGHWIEDNCSCVQSECGLISDENIDEKCEQHGVLFGRAIRQMHNEKDCPGAMNDHKTQ